MLGIDLCSELVSEYEVAGLDVMSTVRSPQTTDFINCDISDKDKTIDSIVNAKPDLVIHTAAWTDVDECEKNPEKAKAINEKGTENVALATLKLNVPMVYISTDYVFDGTKKKPYTEMDSMRPSSVYARTKMYGEKKLAGLVKCIVLRSSWLYGAGDNNFVGAILNEAKTKKEIKVVDDQVGSPTYTKDLAVAIRRLIGLLGTGKAWGVYHVSNKGAVSWFDYAKKILELARIKDVAVVPIKSDELGRAAKRPAFSVLDNTKFEKKTGFKMRTWQEALAEYIRGK